MKKAKKAWVKQKLRMQLTEKVANRMCVCDHRFIIHWKKFCFEGYFMKPTGLKCKCPRYFERKVRSCEW